MTTYAEIATTAGFKLVKRIPLGSFGDWHCSYYRRGAFTLRYTRNGGGSMWRLVDARKPAAKYDLLRGDLKRAPGTTVAAGTRMTDLQAALARLKKERT